MHAIYYKILVSKAREGNLETVNILIVIFNSDQEEIKRKEL